MPTLVYCNYLYVSKGSLNLKCKRWDDNNEIINHCLDASSMTSALITKTKNGGVCERNTFLVLITFNCLKADPLKFFFVQYICLSTMELRCLLCISAA